jgi:hypothetical protein
VLVSVDLDDPRKKLSILLHTSADVFNEMDKKNSGSSKTTETFSTSIKLNTFANFERPSKIDLSELFFGRLKGYVDLFCHFLLLYDHR